MSEVKLFNNGKKLISWPEYNESNSLGISTSWDISIMGEEKSVPNEFITSSRLLGRINDNITSTSIKEIIASGKISPAFSKFLSWSLTSPTNRSSSPFRDKESESYINKLALENNSTLIKESLRLNPSNPLAIARKAIFEIIDNFENPNPIVNANSLEAISIALKMEPTNAEINWYSALALDYSNKEGAYNGINSTNTLKPDQYERIIYVQELLNSESNYRFAILDSAIANSKTEKNQTIQRKFIVKRFLLSIVNNSYSSMKDDWASISKWKAMPPGIDAMQLWEMMAKLTENEADKLFEEGLIEDAINLLRPIAFASLTNDNETLSSSIVKLIEWENENPPLEYIKSDAEWTYLDDGSNPDVEGEGDWQKAWFPEINWKKGEAKLGYGNDGETTRIEYGSDDQNKHITYYFRHKFNISEDSKRTILVSDIIRDDGAVVYFNGSEVHRSNLPQGKIDFETQALTTASPNGEPSERLPTRFSIDPALQVIGENIVAVEIHNSNGQSSDLGFQLSLKGIDQLPGEYLSTKFKNSNGLDLIENSINSLPHSYKDTLRRSLKLAFNLPFKNNTKPISNIEKKKALEIMTKLSLYQKAIDFIDSSIAEDIRASEKFEYLTLKDALLQKNGATESELAEFRQIFSGIKPRDETLSEKLVDLSDHYHVNLQEWEKWGPKNDALTVLVETFSPRNGVDFDLRGVIQLNSGTLDNGWSVNKHTNKSWPNEVKGIKVDNKSPKIHFLTSATWMREKDGEKLASFIIHYNDKTSEEFPVFAGSDVVDWVNKSGAFEKVGIEKIGWSGVGKKNWEAFLSELIWTNPHPEKLITNIDFISNQKHGAPFLVGITLE